MSLDLDIPEPSEFDHDTGFPFDDDTPSEFDLAMMNEMSVEEYRRFREENEAYWTEEDRLRGVYRTFCDELDMPDSGLYDWFYERFENGHEEQSAFARDFNTDEFKLQIGRFVVENLFDECEFIDRFKSYRQENIDLAYKKARQDFFFSVNITDPENAVMYILYRTDGHYATNMDQMVREAKETYGNNVTIIKQKGRRFGEEFNKAGFHIPYAFAFDETKYATHFRLKMAGKYSGLVWLKSD